MLFYNDGRKWPMGYNTVDNIIDGNNENLNIRICTCHTIALFD